MVKIIYHSELEKSHTKDIIGVKSMSWHYTFEQHLEWMNKNLLPNDIHFLVYDDNGLLMSYLNLVNVSVFINNEKISILGIGNVCSRYKGKGDGNKLMIELNDYLFKNHLKGLLFCKESLISFYEKYNWKIIPNVCSDKNIYTMIFNFTKEFKNLNYSDRNF